MTRSSKTTLWTTAFIVLLLVIDQASKIWVKTSMVEGEMHEITSWFKIYFVENEGMAYGITLGSKLLLTLFRILAMGAGVYYLVRLLRLRRFSLGFCLTLGLVIAGGLGNVIDCLFYGEVFSRGSGTARPLGRRLRHLPAWQGGRYAVLPHHPDDLSLVESYPCR